MSYNKLIDLGGEILFGFFLFVVMIDPTNTILHIKDLVFILLVGYHLIAFKPDFSKLPYIIILLCAIIFPYITASISMTPRDEAEAFAFLKAIAPSVLLLWINRYNLIKIARGPVVLCCAISFCVYILININPIAEDIIWTFMQATDYPVMISRRYILGYEIFGFYLKSFVSFVLILAYYLWAVTEKSSRNILSILSLLIIFLAFMISGTRSTMLAPFFLLIVITFKQYGNSRHIRYIMIPLCIVMTIVFIAALVAMISETGEYSNAIKYGHLGSYATLFEDHPWYILFGQGPGTAFYTEGFNQVVTKTEWTYLELLRNFGLCSFAIVYVFARPLITFWKNRERFSFTYCMFWAYLSYLLIAGTNPLLLSSTGMAVLLMAYSYENIILKEANEVDK